jgi:hypothetical protein
MGAPHRRTIYIATLEAHIDRLHSQLLAIGLYPVPFERLEPFKGLNCKTAKVGPFLFFEHIAVTDITEHGRWTAARCQSHQNEIA